jgi:5-methylcytosine-specific restriction endonuclease McrA
MENKIQEIRLKIFKRDKFICQYCGKPIAYGQPQVAHQIPQRKMYLKKYGKEIIHHPNNLKSVCSLKCNSHFDLGIKDELIKNKVQEIIKKIEEDKKILEL